MKARHDKEFKAFEGKLQPLVVTPAPKRPTSSTSTAAEPTLKQQKLNFTSDVLLQKCSDLVTVHGRPLSLFTDKAMQEILSMVPGGIKMYPEKVRASIVQQAGGKRVKAVEYLKNKLISLEFDFAENMGRAFLGNVADLLREGVKQIIMNSLFFQ